MDKLENKTVEALDEILVTIRESKDFIVTEAPAVARELIEFETITCWIGVSVAGIIFIILTALASFIMKKAIEQDDEDFFWAAILVSVVALLDFISFGAWTYSLVKVKIAPKLFLLEYIAEIAR